MTRNPIRTLVRAGAHWFRGSRSSLSAVRVCGVEVGRFLCFRRLAIDVDNELHLVALVAFSDPRTPENTGDSALKPARMPINCRTPAAASPGITDRARAPTSEAAGATRPARDLRPAGPGGRQARRPPGGSAAACWRRPIGTHASLSRRCSEV